VNLEMDVRFVLAAAVVSMRLSMLLALAPIMDNRLVPVLWRLAVALPLGWALAPLAIAYLPEQPQGLSWHLLALEALQSLVLSAILAMAMNLVLAAVRFAGGIIGMQIGFAIVNAYDPQTDSQISVVSHLYFILTVLLFFALDVHLVLIRALVATLVVAPPFLQPDYTPAFGELLRGYSRMFLIGLQASAPVVLVLMLVTAAMGVIVKTTPQIHVLVVGFPVKIGVGILVLGTSLAYFGGVVTQALTATGDLLTRVLGSVS
jgi:flagellar biosynthesis protein FliR